MFNLNILKVHVIVIKFFFDLNIKGLWEMRRLLLQVLIALSLHSVIKAEEPLNKGYIYKLTTRYESIQELP